MSMAGEKLTAEEPLRKVVRDLFGPQWYVIVTGPQKEFTCVRILRQLKLDCFTPKRVEFRRPNKFRMAKREMRYPLMPSYVFVKVDLRSGDDMAKLSSIGYVRGFLAKDGRPWAVPESDRKVRRGRVSRLEIGVDSLRGEVAAPAAHRFMRTHREFKVGEVVKVTDGALAELRWIVREINLEKKVAQIEAEILGAERVVEAPLDQLEKSP